LSGGLTAEQVRFKKIYWSWSVQVGDLVQHFLTEQLGIIIDVKDEGGGTGVLITAQYHVLWTTQGQSLFGAGNKEWCSWSNIDLAANLI